MSFTATETRAYFVVVRGFQGGENTYELCMALFGADCTAKP
jgi:hypothetical protein